MTAMMRWRVIWAWMRRRLSAAPGPYDMEEARRRRVEAEYELEHVRSQSGRVDAAYERMLRQQRDADFTSLVEQTFAPRRNP